MFQFPGFALSQQVFNLSGFPIRTSTDQRSFAPPRSFSQLTTSFIASESLGIPRTPLFASCFPVTIPLICVGLIFCVACVLDARKYDDINNDWP